MDNLAAHKVSGVRQAIEARSAELRYLPPYSPDLNPIENAFRQAQGASAQVRSAKPCRHWLLKPEGGRKEHIERLATDLSWGILENYVRWVANEEAFAHNINDLTDEGTGKLLG
jgi:hypothetical protein